VTLSAARTFPGVLIFEMGNLQNVRRRVIYKFSVFQRVLTRTLVASSIKISSGHGRVNPSAAHLRVASIPIFEP
jgi:hypothetical protein